MARPSKNILSRESIASAAIGLLRKGRQFTIAGLAQELGVHPSSMYHHVPGGRTEIIDLIRAELYRSIDLETLRDQSRRWEERLALWAHEYRRATAAAPWLVPLMAGQPVEDRLTQELYEVLFQLLRQAGLPEADWTSAATMFDVIVLGSAVDAASPVPLWRSVPPELPLLAGAVARYDTEERKLQGFSMAVRAAVAMVCSCTDSAAAE